MFVHLRSPGVAFALSLLGVLPITACATVGGTDQEATGLLASPAAGRPGPAEAEVPLPTARACEEDRVEVALADGDDDRCAHDIVAAAATSFLYVGTGADPNAVSEYDQAHAFEDALEHEEFRQVLRRADAAPRDGTLARQEALDLERRVARIVEGR